MYATKVGPSIAPLMTHGAIDQIGLVRPVIRVWVSQLPKGADAVRRVPRKDLPYLHEVGFDGGFIKEHNTFQHATDLGCTIGEPIRPRGLHSCALVLIRSSKDALILYV